MPNPYVQNLSSQILLNVPAGEMTVTPLLYLCSPTLEEAIASARIFSPLLFFYYIVGLFFETSSGKEDPESMTGTGVI